MAMLSDGLFTRFPKPDTGFALHDGPFPYGMSATGSGSAPPAADDLYIRFRAAAAMARRRR